MLINNNAAPNQSIIYLASCIVNELKTIKMSTPDNLFEIIKNEYFYELDYSTYVIVLDFLFLINKITLVYNGTMN